MSRVGLVLLALTLSACWEEYEEVQFAVWSDDGSQFLVEVVRYERQQKRDMYGTSWDMRDFRHQTYVEDPVSRQRSPLGAEVTGRAGGTLYYMRSGASAPYALRSRLENVDMVFELVRSNGTVSQLGRGALTNNGRTDCSWFEVVPSPDGARLAFLSRGSDCSVAPQVRFASAETLQTVAGPVSVPAMAPGLGAFFQPSGDFVVLNTGETPAAWSVAASGAVTSIAVPDCTYPATTSSSVSAAAKQVEPTNDDVWVGDVAASAAFGCP